MLQVMRTYKAEKNGAEAEVVLEKNVHAWRGQRIRVRMSFNGGVFYDVRGFDSYDEAEEFVLTCDSLFHRVIDGKELPRPEWADEKLYIKKYEMMVELYEYAREQNAA